MLRAHGDHPFECVVPHDSHAAAEHVLALLEKTTDSLESFPNSGSYPAELLELGIREYRQIFFKPYHIVYRVVAQEVVIYLIANERRGLQTLLARRLLEQPMVEKTAAVALTRQDDRRAPHSP